MPESFINIGDLASALKTLKPTSERAQLAIAKTLGMGWAVKLQRRTAKKRKIRSAPEVQAETRSQPSFDRPQLPKKVISL